MCNKEIKKVIKRLERLHVLPVAFSKNKAVTEADIDKAIEFYNSTDFNYKDGQCHECCEDFGILLVAINQLPNLSNDHILKMYSYKMLIISELVNRQFSSDETLNCLYEVVKNTKEYYFREKDSEILIKNKTIPVSLILKMICVSHSIRNAFDKFIFDRDLSKDDLLLMAKENNLYDVIDHPLCDSEVLIRLLYNINGLVTTSSEIGLCDKILKSEHCSAAVLEEMYKKLSYYSPTAIIITNIAWHPNLSVDLKAKIKANVTTLFNL